MKLLLFHKPNLNGKAIHDDYLKTPPALPGQVELLYSDDNELIGIVVPVDDDVIQTIHQHRMVPYQ